MAEAYLSIGGRGVHLVGDVSVARAMRLPGMREFMCSPRQCEMEVRLDVPLSLPPCQWAYEFDIADGGIHCRFGTDAGGVYYQLFEGYGLLRYREGGGVEIETLSDPSALRFALWSAYGLMGVRCDAVPVHSSVVVCNGRAVMCLGESGTGKSTHTRLWLENIPGSYRLNDDSPIVSVTDGQVRVYGSPWSGKSDYYLQESHLIAALLRLQQRPENSICRLNVLQSFSALQPSCPPAMAREERCLDALVAFISKVLRSVPVYRMGCLPNADAAWLSHDTIMGRSQQ
jgi:hypothetical protein